MLYVSLIVSAALLMLANRAVRRSASPGIAVSLWGAAFVFTPFLMMCILPAVAIHSLLLWIAVLIWQDSDRGPSYFLKLSCGATVLAYGLAGVLVFRSEREYQRLRRLYPYESMEARVPAPKHGTGAAPLNPASEARLSAIEGKITEEPNEMRESQLSRLHEEAVGLFVNSPGFGVSRMFLPAEWNLRFGLRREPVPPQPGPRSVGDWSPGDWKSPSDVDETQLGNLLDDSVFDFVNSRGFGYTRDGRHVAGFETHRFSEVPRPKTRWEVQTIDLVSLLLHDPPEVYVSDHLPQMDAMHGTPTRPPDRFERAGLETLRRGEDLFISESGEGLRMLGAIRNAGKCIVCHNGRRGDLLGAFSYNIHPVAETVGRAGKSSLRDTLSPASPSFGG
jgi:hypothetical protein